MKIDHLPLVPKLTKGIGYWDEPKYVVTMPKRLSNAVKMALGGKPLSAVSSLSHYAHTKIEWRK